ncbi:hypothetical protein C8J57DRAFT_1226109 [Mycena rebaudengoi]|nr:hypothetical protein C8J57DRAFT_1226109 [Mycena rebaudengoi]
MPVSLKTWHFYILVTNERAGYPHLNESTFRNISITSQEPSHSHNALELEPYLDDKAIITSYLGSLLCLRKKKTRSTVKRKATPGIEGSSTKKPKTTSVTSTMLDIFGSTAHSNINSIPKNPIAGLIWDSRNMNLDPGRHENSRDTVRRMTSTLNQLLHGTGYRNQMMRHTIWDDIPSLRFVTIGIQKVGLDEILYFGTTAGQRTFKAETKLTSTTTKTPVKCCHLRTIGEGARVGHAMPNGVALEQKFQPARGETLWRQKQRLRYYSWAAWCGLYDDRLLEWLVPRRSQGLWSTAIKFVSGPSPVSGEFIRVHQYYVNFGEIYVVPSLHQFCRQRIHPTGWMLSTRGIARMITASGEHLGNGQNSNRGTVRSDGIGGGIRGSITKCQSACDRHGIGVQYKHLSLGSIMLVYWAQVDGGQLLIYFMTNNIVLLVATGQMLCPHSV